MRLVRFYVGHNVKGKPTHQHTEVRLWCEKNLPDGFTIVYGSGGWMGQSEACSIIDVMLLSNLEASSVKRSLEVDFQQEKVLAVSVPAIEIEGI